MSNTDTTRRDVHAEITSQLVASIEASPGQFTLPWRRNGGALRLPTNALTGNRYNGINILSLWVAAESRGYTAPIWGTYRQWAQKGAQVSKGEKSSLVVFYKDSRPIPIRRIRPTRVSAGWRVLPMCSMRARSMASTFQPSRRRWVLWSGSAMPTAS